MEATLEQKEVGKKLLSSLVTKAQDDKEFRYELVTNPYQVLEKIGCPESNLPKDVKIKFEDQTDETVVYLNIPRKVDTESIELTDEQLELVAGGEFLVSFGIGVGIGVCAVGVAYVASHVHISWN
ncbi:hypothetical protein GGR92_004001 [Spirosoma lacussanchae]|uniref:NHLP leader peptide family RiPP precursor n=1 Tax=Spirosoma lacussanchae TaxID=1884249 RepID=UPI001107EA8C|nr:NHLP leader peptide family RiPP precursor [Spirosoma lacussanchae]